MNQSAMTVKAFPRIIFMGTPEFAVASLDALVKAGYPVVAVVTAPDKPSGRGLHIQQSPVKQYALAHNLPVLQPEKLKHPDFLDVLKSYKADVQVVVAFRMLPEVVWDMPPLGTINVHGSLLPQYRGAAPINWAIINGETETGVTTFKLKHAIDTGDMLLQQPIPIGPEETAGELHDRMKETGAQLLIRTIEGLTEGSLVPQPQPITVASVSLKHAPKIFTDTCRIIPDQPVEKVHNLIRGLSPFPGAFTHLDGKMLKIYRSKISNDLDGVFKPGQWLTDGKHRLSLACSNGWLDCEDVQLEGKKKMLVEDFLRGYRFGENSNVILK